MKVRPPEWNDFPDLVDNYYSLYDELPENPSLGIILFAQKPSMAEEAAWFSGFYRDLLEGRGVAAVAEIEGHTVGLCEVRRRGAQDELRHVGLLGMFIRRGFRGKGVGTALMGDVLARCRGMFEIVELGVFSVNQTAISLYTRFGFRRTGTRPRHFKRGSTYFDEDVMQLDLDHYSPPERPAR